MPSLWSATGSLVKRCKLFVLVLMCWALVMEAKTPVIRRHHGNNTKALIYVSIALIVFLAVLVIGYIARELCPRGPIFTPLELDEIRLDHLDDIESSLKQNINALKDKLAYHRKKKTQVQTDRDIKRRLGERVEKFNDKGRSIYGEAWDEGDIPVKAVVAMTTKEVQELRRDAEHIVEQRKQEEKEDLWKLWNDMRQDGGAKPAQSSGADASYVDKQALLQRDSKKYVHTGTASIAESIYKMQNNVTINNNISVNSYNNTIKQQNNNNFELTNNGKFSSPVNTKQQSSTYSYNNTSYGYADNDAEQSQGLLKPQASPGSALRLQPPILDLSKITTAPAHIKPPPNKPPAYQPTAQTTSTSNPMNSYPMGNNNNGNHMLSRPSAGGPPGAGGPQRGPQRGPPMSGEKAGTQPGTQPGAQPGGQSAPMTAQDRESMRPSMRSYVPGKRPPPPAGPKPAALTNNINTDGAQYNTAINTNNSLYANSSAGFSSSTGAGEGAVNSGSGASLGPPGVRSMKRPPPPMMAPPGYVPGNSRRGSGSGKNSGRASFNTDDKEH